MASFVLDASVTIAGISRDEANLACVELIRKTFAEEAAVPPLWFYEVANIFARKRQRGLLFAGEHEAMLIDLQNLQVECDAHDMQAQCERASRLALEHELTVYDAAYLELAIRRKLPLATLDKKLARAASAEHIRVLP